MNFGLFLMFTTVGTVIWNTVLIYLGAAVGSQWETIVHYMDIYSNIAYVILGIIGIAVIIWYIRKRKQTKKSGKSLAILQSGRWLFLFFHRIIVYL